MDVSCCETLSEVSRPVDLRLLCSFVAGLHHRHPNSNNHHLYLLPWQQD